MIKCLISLFHQWRNGWFADVTAASKVDPCPYHTAIIAPLYAKVISHILHNIVYCIIKYLIHNFEFCDGNCKRIFVFYTVLVVD